jgi:tRNA (guanine-N7-)-methyltransferase
VNPLDDPAGSRSWVCASEDAIASGELPSQLCEARLSDLTGTNPFLSAFGRSRPVELEIGCGKGRFLIRSAESFAERGFLGVERAGRFYRVALARAQRRRLTNLRLIQTDALFLLRFVLPAGSLSAIHVLFPDPWPKKRHHKRRLVAPAFVEAAERVLQDGGKLNVATDHQDYAAVIWNLLNGAAHLKRAPEFDLDERLPPGEIGHTNYEVKYRAVGRPIRQGTWRRKPRGDKKPGET